MATPCSSRATHRKLPCNTKSAVTAAAQLVEKDPENAGYLATLTVSHERVGDALLAQGNMTDALAEYRRALDLADELSDVDPVNFQWRET